MPIHKRKTIHLLPMHVSNQIAAGEVVERPANVVKELLENSLDAGASQIDIHIEQGGQGLIRIRDNGLGIPADELPLAVQRHATSKLKDISDLWTLQDYGFRGEALASVASVSSFRMESAFEKEGAYLDVLHGHIIKEGPASLQQGTLIEVRDLFAAVPARLKFLKSAATELRKIQEIVFRTALARLDVGFTLSAEKGEIFRFYKDERLEERLSQVWPKDLVSSLIPFEQCLGHEENAEGIKLCGLAASPEKSMPRSSHMLFYVNQRPINDKMLIRACREGYKGRLLGNQYPALVLFADISPQELDINVHPAKSELRFRHEKLVFSAVYKALSNTINAHCLSSVFPDFQQKTEEKHAFLPEQINFPPSEGSNSDCKAILCQSDEVNQPLRNSAFEPRPQGFWGSFDKEEILPKRQAFADEALDGICAEHILGKQFSSDFYSVHEEPADVSNFYKRSEGTSDEFGSYSLEEAKAMQEAAESQKSTWQESSVGHNTWQSQHKWEYLGQIAATYLLVREGSRLIIIDQHAFHESVIFRRLRSQNAINTPQTLLLPIELTLSGKQNEKAQELLPHLREWSFICTLQEGALRVDAVPSLLNRSKAQEFLKEALDNNYADFDEILHRLACHSSIRAGEHVSPHMAALLFDEWHKDCDRYGADALFCPHGRPVMRIFAQDDLAKLFKR